MPRKGNLALISQSGALGMGMIYLANNEFVGLSKIIGVGNKLESMTMILWITSVKTQIRK